MRKDAFNVGILSRFIADLTFRASQKTSLFASYFRPSYIHNGWSPTA